MAHLRCLLPVPALLLLPALLVCAQDNPYGAITLYNRNPAQGDAMVLQWRSLQPDCVPLYIADTVKIPFFRLGDSYLAVYGRDLRLPPGRVVLPIILSVRGARKQTSMAVSFASRRFASRRLPKSIKRGKVRTAEEKARRARERDQLNKALAHRVDKAYFLDGFRRPIQPSEPREYHSFGKRTIMGKEELSRHKGVDISRPKGTSVCTPMSGEVVLCGRDFFYEGNLLIIAHGPGMFTIFCHVHRFAVKPGDIVGAGDVVATVGSSGRATGPHLHWQIKYYGRDVNPLSFAFINQAVAPIFAQ